MRDEAGKIRATLGILNSSGEACLSLHDKQGIPRLYVELVPGLPDVMLPATRRKSSVLIWKARRMGRRPWDFLATMQH